MIRLNRHLIVKALKAQYALLTAPGTTPEQIWEAHLLKGQIEFLDTPAPLPITMLTQIGGTWLGSLREWLQCKAINGSDVTWGSHQPLRFSSPLTVYDFEYLAARTAAQAIQECLQLDGKPKHANA